MTKKFLAAFLVFLFLISDFMGDEFFVIVALCTLYGLIFWGALKKRMKLLTYTQTTLGLMAAKILCDFCIILPVCVIPFLLMNTPYQYCFLFALFLTFVWELYLFYKNRKKGLQKE